MAEREEVPCDLRGWEFLGFRPARPARHFRSEICSCFRPAFRHVRRAESDHARRAGAGDAAGGAVRAGPGGGPEGPHRRCEERCRDGRGREGDVDRGRYDRRRGQHRRSGRAAPRRACPSVRRGTGAVHARQLPARVHLGARAPAGVRGQGVHLQPRRPHRHAHRRRRPGVRGHRLQGQTGLRRRHAGRIARIHQGQGPALPDRHRQDRHLRADRRGHQTPQRQRELGHRARGRPVCCARR